ncbi:MAG: hypothetical protein D6803_06495 [Anaerolineae bacterium]|nr:MAG: hypothetical protein D6803_06495 [Anaerolineae bacterium]
MHWMKRISLLIAALLTLAACNAGGEALAPPATPTTAPTATLPPPSATPIPLAASVNGEGILLAEFQAEVARFQMAVGTDPTAEDESRILQSMIDEVLLAQAAAEAGFVVDEAMVQERLAQMDIDETELQAWLEQHGYTRDEFLKAMRRAIAAAWMRDQIIAATPRTGEHVHARQILLYNSDDAAAVLAQLQNGADFATLAEQYDPTTGGDLGWFPRGYLTVAEYLDDAVFSLSEGEFSDVLTSPIGYHIVQVIERDTERPYTPDAYRLAQQQYLENWLAERRNQSEIVITLP